MKTVILLIIFLTTNTIFSQEFQGIATYRSSQSVTVKMDSTQVNASRAKEMSAMMASQFDNEFKLEFNNKESLYRMEEKLKLEGQQGRQGTMIISGMDMGQSPIYKNTSTETYVKDEDLMGKRFLVKDNLIKPDWKIESEQKKIGNYTVIKATWTRDVEISNWDKDMVVTKTTVPKTTIAWFTPEIPVNHGPREFWGLPGLIMEIQEGKSVILCTGIVLNPKEKFTIEVPSKGKTIDQAAYDKIKGEKDKEMREQFGKERKEGFQMRIGN